MELGLNLGYWGAGNDADNIALAQEADRLGYSVVWAAEAYGSDSPTVLAWVGALTERIGQGAAVMQIPAPTPATTPMTPATHDTLSGTASGSPTRSGAPASTSTSSPRRCAARPSRTRGSTGPCRCRTVRARRCG